MTIEQKIAEEFCAEFAATGSVSLAFNKVFGAGAYEQFAGDLYDALRAKVGK
jgi:hypothetical protein